MDDSPATKGDIGMLRQEMHSEIGVLRQEMHSEIGVLRQEASETEARMTETMRNIETNLLKAFYGCVETTRQRFAFIEGGSENVMTRMKIIEERVCEIEKRLNLPPAL